MTSTLLIDLFSEQRFVNSNLCTFLGHPVFINRVTRSILENMKQAQAVQKDWASYFAVRTE